MKSRTFLLPKVQKADCSCGINGLMKSWTAFTSSPSTGTFCSSACRCDVAVCLLKPRWGQIMHRGNVYLATEGRNSTRGWLIHFDWEEVEDQRRTGQVFFSLWLAVETWPLLQQFSVWQEIRWRSWHVFPQRCKLTWCQHVCEAQESSLVLSKTGKNMSQSVYTCTVRRRRDFRRKQWSW